MLDGIISGVALQEPSVVSLITKLSIKIFLVVEGFSTELVT